MSNIISFANAHLVKEFEAYFQERPTAAGVKAVVAYLSKCPETSAEGFLAGLDQTVIQAGSLKNLIEKTRGVVQDVFSGADHDEVKLQNSVEIRKGLAAISQSSLHSVFKENYLAKLSEVKENLSKIHDASSRSRLLEDVQSLIKILRSSSDLCKQIQDLEAICNSGPLFLRGLTEEISEWLKCDNQSQLVKDWIVGSFETLSSIDEPMVIDKPMPTQYPDHEPSSASKNEGEKSAASSALELFLELPQLKNLSHEVIEVIHRVVKESKQSSSLESGIKKIFKDNQIDYREVDHEVQIITKKNLFTLLARVFKEKSSIKEGIFTYWNELNTFFENKTIRLQLPLNGHMITSDIKKAEKRGNTWIFHLDNYLSICIEDTGAIVILQPENYKLLEMIYQDWELVGNDNLNMDNIFSLKYLVHRSNPSYQKLSSYLQEGQYQAIRYEYTDVHSQQLGEGQMSLKSGFKRIKNMVSKEWNSFWGSSKKDSIQSAQKEINHHIANSSYREIYLEGKNPKGYFFNYKIRAYQDDKQHDQLVQIYILKDQQYVNNGPLMTIENFNETYGCAKTIAYPVVGIDPTNIDQYCKIRKEEDVNKNNLRLLSEINEEVDTLRASLANEKELLKALLEDLVQNRLDYISQKAIDDLTPQHQKIKEELDRIASRYLTELGISRTSHMILKQMVEEANYAEFEPRHSHQLNLKAMELLSESNDYLKKIENKDIILFVGNTGSGKSTAINYLLGSDLEYKKNSFGDEVIVQSSQPSNSLNDYPKIGQLLGQSETLYTTGYEKEGSPFVFADCPGFMDTRGTDHELCANLSIDRAVAKAKSVKAIVIVLPVHAFLSDRMNGLIEVIETVQERFKNLLDINNMNNSKNLFLLITKQNQVNPESVDSIIDGSRFEALLNEANNTLNRIFSEQHQYAMADDFEVQSAIKRTKLWSALLTLHDNDQIHFIDVRDEDGAEELFKRYTDQKKTQPEIAKDRYVSAMQGSDIQRKFGQHIEGLTHTWTSKLLEEYHQRIPALIQESNQKIQDGLNDKDRFETELANKKIELEEKQNIEKTILQLIQKLENVQQDPKMLQDQEYQGILIQESDESTANMLNKLKEDVISTEDHIQVKQKEVVELKKKIDGVLKKIENIGLQIAGFKKKKSRLEKGSYQDILWTSKTAADEILSLQSLVAGAHQKAHQEMRPIKSEEVTKTEFILASAYRGGLVHNALIEKKYRLVPADAEMEKQLMSIGTYSNGRISSEAGEYKAIVEGERFEFYLGRKSGNEGTKVAYSFITHWKGDILPWIRISHTIPNIDYNKVTIQNMMDDIEALERNKRNLERDLKGEGLFAMKSLQANKGLANKEIALFKQKKRDLTLQMERLEQEKVEAEKKQIQASLDRLFQSKQHELEFIRNEIQSLAHQEKELTTNLEENSQYRDLLKKNQEEQLLRKKHLAIVIKSKWENALLLREFTSIVFQNEKVVGQKKGAVDGCRKFQTYFDENKSYIIQELAKDLNFA